MWHYWALRFLDTTFFRESTPFQAGESVNRVIGSRFPPTMQTLQGVLRSNLAAGQGWHPRGVIPWPTTLGDAEHLGELKLRGPYLVRGNELLFTAPYSQTYASGDRGTQMKRVVPGASVRTDLGYVRLPVLDGDGKVYSTGNPAYVNRYGLYEILNDRFPKSDQIVFPEQLWSTEPRMGIKRDLDTRVVQEGMLYNSAHIRPNIDLELAVLVNGVTPEWLMAAPRVTAVGGEGRPAAISAKADYSIANILPSPPDVPRGTEVIQFTVSLLTPGSFADIKQVAVSGPKEMGVDCMCACLGKAEYVGGWDLANNSPRALMPMLPSGSTWYYETSQEVYERAVRLHGECIGEKTTYGFGQIVIGRWG
ncbi:MAG: hypothetical protein FD169_1876 [Bacillota bacterium]|nr:MAG: hypothetical protein FD169_1876 [Bacillota bacterium]